jgi:DNA polymerase
MNGKQWADVKRDEPELARRLIEYAKQDVINCREIWVKHGHKWPAHERALSELTIKQGRDGVAIDTELLRRGLELTTTALRKIEAILPWTEQGKKPTGSKAIADQCIKAGIPAPPIIKHEGEEAYEEWEKEFGDKHEWVRNVSVWRSVNKVLSTLETMKARLRPDNTIDFSLLYFGGHTGRWSGGGSGLNMQNLRKDPLLFDTDGRYVFEAARLKEYAASKDTKPAWLAHELNMRHLICARPGHKFVIVDAAQIEPRCLNWLAGNFTLLNKIAEGFSYYEAYAATFEGWSGAPGSIKKSLGPAAYTKLKNKCLGLGYGMGWAKYVDYAGVDEEEAKKVVEGFRAENPLIAGSGGLWSRLDTAYRGCAAKPMQKPAAEHTFESELPSGRCLTYPNVKSEWRNTMGKDKKWHMKLQVTCEVGFRREKLYGGKLTENLVQATARDVFAYHMLELVANGLPVVFHVHDENIIEVPEGDAPAALKKAIEIMSVPPPWLPGCPLSAEGIIADHYKK